MYIVKVGNNKIYDPRIDDLVLIDPMVELEENSAGSFSFTMPYNHPSYDLIKRRKSIIQVFEDDELVFSGMAMEAEEDFYHNKKVYCEGELSYLNDSIQRPAEYHDMTVLGLFTAYINKHNSQVEPEKQFKVGMVTVKDSNDSIFCYTNMESTMKSIKEDLLDDLGGILRVRYENGEKYIDYLATTDVRTNSQVIRLGENLIDYKSNISSLDIATAIIPLGERLEESPIPALDMRLDIKEVNDGLDYVYDEDAVATYGWIYKTVIWDGVTQAANLKKKGETYLSSTQFDNLWIEVVVVDLHLVDPNETAFRLSDQIMVHSINHGLKNKYFRLTKQTLYLNTPDKNTFTLGKEEQIPLSVRTSQNNVEAIKNSITPASKILDMTKKNATAILNANGKNGHIVMHLNEDDEPYELLIMDTKDIDTATRVWRFNDNGWGYSSNGYYGEYEMAATMDGGFVADFINTGSMLADRVRGGDFIVGGSKFVDSKSSIKGLNANDQEIYVIDKDGFSLKCDHNDITKWVWEIIDRAYPNDNWVKFMGTALLRWHTVVYGSTPLELTVNGAYGELMCRVNEQVLWRISSGLGYDRGYLQFTNPTGESASYSATGCGGKNVSANFSSIRINDQIRTDFTGDITIDGTTIHVKNGFVTGYETSGGGGGGGGEGGTTYDEGYVASVSGAKEVWAIEPTIGVCTDLNTFSARVGTRHLTPIGNTTNLVYNGVTYKTAIWYQIS